MGTQRYLLSKVGQLFLTLLLILTLAFFLFRVWQPGDPVQTFARQSGAHYSEEQLAALRHEWGLDIPLPQQYVRYMKEMLTFNFGVSTIVNPGESVSKMFFERMGKSIILILLSTLASIAIGVLLGIYGGWRRQRPTCSTRAPRRCCASSSSPCSATTCAIRSPRSRRGFGWCRRPAWRRRPLPSSR